MRGQDVLRALEHGHRHPEGGVRDDDGPVGAGREHELGGPIEPCETVVSLIANTTNRGDLVVRARLDRRSYPIGKKVSAKDLPELNIERDAFHGDWSYLLGPREHA